MKKNFILTLIIAVMASGNLLAQHHAVKTTTEPNKGATLEYGISDLSTDRAMTDEPSIIWEKYESGAMPDDVFYIDATGDYLVYYGLNQKRVTLFDSQGEVKWEKPISSGGRAAVSLMGNAIAYSDDNELYVVNIEGTEIFHETFDYPVSHFKLDSDGTRIFVTYGRYEDSYYAIACYGFGVTKSDPIWVVGDLTVNPVGISLSKNNARLVVAFAQGYKQIWVIDPMTGDILQNDLYYYDNSPSQDPALSANGDYLAYADFSGMAYLYHWNGERYESVWTASIAGPGATSTWGCANTISDDGSLIAIGTLDFVNSSSGYDGCCYLFNNYSNEPIWSYTGCGDEVTQAAMSDDGSVIGFVTWGPMDHSTPDFFLFRKQSGTPIAELTTPGSMEHIDISATGLYTIIGGKAVHCREMGSGSRVYAIQSIADNMGILNGIVNLEGTGNNSGVTITINELEDYFETTAEDGSFTIRAIPEGSYSVTAGIPGYLPVTENISISGGEITTLNINMEAVGTPISDLYASQGAYDYVELTWSEQDGATGYNIYRKNTLNAPFGEPMATIGTGEGYFEDHTAIPTQQYYYTVTAQLDEELQTPYSNICLGYATTAYITHTIDVYDGAAPTIDGIMSDGEWNDAFRVEVSNYLLPVEMGSVTLHLKMDDNYLYVCSENRMDTEWTNNDGVAFYIDDNNDGTYPPQGDDSEGNYWMYYGTPNTVRYRPIYDNGGVGTVINLPEEIIACDMSQGYETIEFALPLGNDETWKLNTDNGSSGLYLFVRDAATATMFGKWPAENNETFAPTYYGVMNYHVENAVPEPPTNLRIDEAVNAQGVYTPIMWDMPVMNDFDHFNLYFVDNPDQHEEVYGTQWIFEVDDEEEVSIYVTTVDQAGQESVPSETLTFRPGSENVNEYGQASLSLYPNPTHNVLNLNADLQDRTEVMILDMNGRTVKHYVVNGLNEMRLNVSDLQSGVYFIRVCNETTTALSKFIVE
ncbi:MAG: T9SS type A sorting domain-containing protein [Bacteroidales bacterium]|nr:T9SS type A sorting domain-containing protein [Bacteroidales bacterium]MBR6227786.1 T9SS type A sorting domain-containing protein [Bacteroidales bacterium]